MKFDNNGLVEGGIECGYKDLQGNPVIEITYDLENWLFRQLNQLKEASNNRNNIVHPIWIGSLENYFASIIVDGKSFIVEYNHSKFIQKNGFFLPSLGKFRSTSFEKVVNDILGKIMRVDMSEWENNSSKYVPERFDVMKYLKSQN